MVQLPEELGPGSGSVQLEGAPPCLPGAARVRLAAAPFRTAAVAWSAASRMAAASRVVAFQAGAACAAMAAAASPGAIPA